ncbi:hypothetical protein [Pseudactinotalea sp. HY158]|nr:hypothetical protein [Pseudactinotalea sp. HY158]
MTDPDRVHAGADLRAGGVVLVRGGPAESCCGDDRGLLSPSTLRP